MRSKGKKLLKLRDQLGPVCLRSIRGFLDQSGL